MPRMVCGGGRQEGGVCFFWGGAFGFWRNGGANEPIPLLFRIKWFDHCAGRYSSNRAFFACLETGRLKTVVRSNGFNPLKIKKYRRNDNIVLQTGFIVVQNLLDGQHDIT